MNHIILYNKLAGHARAHEEVEEYASRFENPTVIDVTATDGYDSFFKLLGDEDEIIVCGGDGTLNHFVNNIEGHDLKNKIFYHAIGSGNDFLHDVSPEGAELVEITDYVKDLPRVSVNGKESLFINGIGYGIDGYCCEVGDIQRAKSDKPVNYTSIAIKGLLFHYKPTNATVRVDGTEYKFKKVWICPTMHGRLYGGGMMPTPDQKRNNEEGKLSVLVFHGSSKLKTLMIFPSLFKGEHVKHTKYITILEGKSIEVAFDRPTALQIDGETVLNVTEYKVTSGKTAEIK